MPNARRVAGSGATSIGGTAVVPRQWPHLGAQRQRELPRMAPGAGRHGVNTIDRLLSCQLTTLIDSRKSGWEANLGSKHELNVLIPQHFIWRDAIYLYLITRVGNRDLL